MEKVKQDTGTENDGRMGFGRQLRQGKYGMYLLEWTGIPNELTCLAALLPSNGHSTRFNCF